MGSKQLRWFTFAVSVITLVLNGLSASLFQRFSDNLHWTSGGFAFYSYFAAFVSAVGVFGSIKQHAYSMSIFANFFLLDTIASAILRSILLYIFSTFRRYICDDRLLADGFLSLTLPHGTFHQTNPGQVGTARALGAEEAFEEVDAAGLAMWDNDWGCAEILRISFLVGWASLAAASSIQMFFAILVRQYASSLFFKPHQDREKGVAHLAELAWEKQRIREGFLESYMLGQP